MDINIQLLQRHLWNNQISWRQRLPKWIA